MDTTDQQFEPCPCGYKMCAFCFNRICSANNGNPSCPHCRKPYDLSNISIPHINKEDNHHSINHNTTTTFINNNTSNKPKTKTKKQRTSSNHHSSSNNNDDMEHHSKLSYDELSNIRVRQKNLVYVVGLPIGLCDEQTLKTNKWFGRFGKIKKVYCNKKSSHVRTGSFAAFITFYSEKSAMSAISCMNGKQLDDGSRRILKATTGIFISYHITHSLIMYYFLQQTNKQQVQQNIVHTFYVHHNVAIHNVYIFMIGQIKRMLLQRRN